MCPLTKILEKSVDEKIISAAQPINSSALPDKLFNPRHQPFILYLSVREQTDNR